MDKRDVSLVDTCQQAESKPREVHPLDSNGGWTEKTMGIFSVWQDLEENIRKRFQKLRRISSKQNPNCFRCF